MIKLEGMFRGTKGVYERQYDTETGIVEFVKANLTPSLYLPSKGNEKTDYKFILNQSKYLEKKTFTNTKEYSDFTKKYKGVLDFYGTLDPVLQHIRDNYFYEDRFNYNKRLWYFDIETEQPSKADLESGKKTGTSGFPNAWDPENRITLIQIYDSTDNVYYVLGLDDWTPSEELQSELGAKIFFKNCKDEKIILADFMSILEKKVPAVITAWNGEKFDFPYIYNRLRVLGFDPERLSPLGKVNKRMVSINKDKQIETYQWNGIIIIDLMNVYKKFTFKPRTSYSLSNIAKVELGDDKINYSEFANLTDLSEKDYDKFVEYGIKDVALMIGIDKKHSLLDIVSSIAHRMGVGLEDSMGTVKPWGTYISNKALEIGLVLPNDKSHHVEGIKGGWVDIPVKGKHDWVVSFDWSSLYPSIIRFLNMSAETYVTEEQMSAVMIEIRDFLLHDYMVEESRLLDLDSDKSINIPVIKEGLASNVERARKYIETKTAELQEQNVGLSPNGSFYRNDKQGLVPKLVEDIFVNRKKSKNKMGQYKQRAGDIKEILKARG